MFAGRLQHVYQADLGPAAIGELLAFAPGVLQAQLHRVHAELLGQLVERGLEREEGLGPRRRAVGVDRRLVGRDLVGGEGVVGHCVRTREEHPGQVRVPPRGGAVVPDHADLEGREGAVALRAQLHVGVAGRRGAADLELLAARQSDLDRLPEALRQQRG